MIDPDTDPARVGPQVVHPVGDGAPEAWHHEVVHAHRRGLPLGGPFAPAILEVAHQFLLLGVDRDRRLPRAQGGPDPGVDVLELRVAIGVVRPFHRLPVGLQAVVQLVEQLRDHPMARAVSLAGRVPPPAAGRSCTSSARATPDPPAPSAQSASPSPRSASDPGRPSACARHPGGESGRPPAARPARLQLLRPDPNRPPGHAGGPRHQRHPAAPDGLGLGRRDQSSHPFIEILLDELEPPPDRARVHHPRDNIQSPHSISGTFIS